ncbi:MAG: TldD/PmbA family protein [Bacteroidota bacterium]
MIGQEKAFELCERLLNASKADQTEVMLYGNDSKLTRFANSEIHQNVAEADTEVRIRVALGKKLAVTSVNQLDERALKEALERAIELARFQPENPEFHSLPSPKPIQNVDHSSIPFSAADRAAVAGTICRRALEKELVASGAFQTAERELLVANSLGIRAYTASTYAELSTVVMGADSSGYADMVSLDPRTIDGEALAQEAIKKALDSRNPIDLEPGAYTVLLEEYAVNEVLNYFSYPGFGARAFHDGSSFMSDKLGERITGEQITIWDDGLDPSGLLTPFDFEGVPKERLCLIERGVAKGVAYDSFFGFKYGHPSTGHALPAPNPDGPLPFNLFMEGGSTPKAELIRGIERGIWVTRFHYVNHLDPRLALITGMTRDGTFLIEDGRISRPIKNLRFTENLLEAFSRVEKLGKETKLEPGFFHGNRVPAMVLRDFHFSGKTDF